MIRESYGITGLPRSKYAFNSKESDVQESRF